MARKFSSRTPRRVPQDSQPHMSSPPRRSFGVPNALGIHHPGDILDVDERRISRQASWTRSNILSRLISQDDDSVIKSPASERPPIPSALHARELDSTPLPVVSMIVLSIVSTSLSHFATVLSLLQTMLGEFLSANVSMPFLLFMVKGMASCHLARVTPLEIDRCRI